MTPEEIEERIRQNNEEIARLEKRIRENDERIATLRMRIAIATAAMRN